jgi:acetate---CoA ligase (ADP-forming)
MTDTKVIVGYLEDISDGDKFVKAAEEASSRKPVVILKAGTTSAGSRAAANHTGVLAGKDTAYGAAFKRAGICRADSFEALFDYATALALQPTPRGDRVSDYHQFRRFGHHGRRCRGKIRTERNRTER